MKKFIKWRGSKWEARTYFTRGFEIRPQKAGGYKIRELPAEYNNWLCYPWTKTIWTDCATILELHEFIQSHIRTRFRYYGITF